MNILHMQREHLQSVISLIQRNDLETIITLKKHAINDEPYMQRDHLQSFVEPMHRMIQGDYYDNLKEAMINDYNANSEHTLKAGVFMSEGDCSILVKHLSKKNLMFCARYAIKNIPNAFHRGLFKLVDYNQVKCLERALSAVYHIVGDYKIHEIVIAYIHDTKKEKIFNL